MTWQTCLKAYPLETIESAPLPPLPTASAGFLHVAATGGAAPAGGVATKPCAAADSGALAIGGGGHWGSAGAGHWAAGTSAARHLGNSKQGGPGPRGWVRPDHRRAGSDNPLQEGRGPASGGGDPPPASPRARTPTAAARDS